MKRTNHQTLIWLFQVPGKNKRIIAALVVLQVLNGMTGVATALLLKMIVDSAVAGDLQAFGRTAFLMILLIIGEQGVQALLRWLKELGRASFENAFKLRLTENILSRSYASVSAVHSGEWMNRLTNDTKVVADGFTDIIPSFIGMVVRFISAVIMIVFIDWNFSGHHKKGIDLLKEIRKKTSLLYIVMMSANQLRTDIPLDSIIEMMNEENFFYLDRSNDNFESVVAIIDKIRTQWSTKFDCVLEQWLIRHPEDNNKEAFSEASTGKTYTWEDILVELKLVDFH